MLYQEWIKLTSDTLIDLDIQINKFGGIAQTKCFITHEIYGYISIDLKDLIASIKMDLDELYYLDAYFPIFKFKFDSDHLFLEIDKNINSTLENQKYYIRESKYQQPPLSFAVKHILRRIL